jgi:3'-phosphoadenosine 5'-phosphosulfate sulfotransferase (PAPS reductase)/FAD synthetase
MRTKYLAQNFRGELMEKQKYIVVSFSGGKDSTAMLLKMIELKEHIDEVIFCDTYKEFPQMYTHIEKVKKVVEDNGIKFTTIKNEKSFDYFMLEKPIKRKNPEKFIARYGKEANGYSWAHSHTRWCTKEMKIQVINKYLRELNEKYFVIQCVGIAADETKRLERDNQKQESHRHPLVEWGWNEKQCLEYCYSLGYDWSGLYKIFDRVSCWCCPLKTLEELRQLRKHFPELWAELMEMDKKAFSQFKTSYSVEELEIRFNFEEERIAEGKSIRNREFFTELKKLL